MKRLLVVVVALSFLLALGCFPASNHTLYIPRFEPPLGSLLERATFDLDCSQDNLSLKPLGKWDVQGVSGCGKRAVYVYIGGQWLLNTDGQHEAIQAAIIEKQRREEERRRREDDERREEEHEELMKLHHDQHFNQSCNRKSDYADDSTYSLLIDYGHDYDYDHGKG